MLAPSMVPSLHGKQWKQCQTLFFWAPKSPQMVTAAMKLKDAYSLDFPGGSDGKVSAYNVGDPGSIPGSGRSPGEGNGNHSSTFAWRIPWMEDPGWL